MIKVSVMYPNTPGARFNHEYYRDRLMPLVKSRMGDSCKYYTIDKGLAGGAPPLPQPTLQCATFPAIRLRHFRLVLDLTRRRSWRTSRTHRLDTGHPDQRSSRGQIAFPFDDLPKHIPRWCRLDFLECDNR